MWERNLCLHGASGKAVALPSPPQGPGCSGLLSKKDVLSPAEAARWDAVGPLAPYQQLSGEPLCPLLCPTACSSCFQGSGECVCSCVCGTEDVVSWSWSMRGGEALVTCVKDDVSLPCLALSNFSTG